MKSAQEKKDSVKNSRLKKFFRITLDEYKAVEKHQAEGSLGILLGTTRRALDHCHTTGRLRGILDWRINRALGLIENGFKERTAEVLRALASYMEHYPVDAVLGPRWGIIGKAKRKLKMIYGSANGIIKETKKVRG